MVDRLIHKLFLSCDEATLYIEENLAKNLTLPQRMRLKGHLFFCKWCRIYNKKVYFIDKALEGTKISREEEMCSEADIARLKRKIKEKITEK